MQQPPSVNNLLFFFFLGLVLVHVFFLFFFIICGFIVFNTQLPFWYVSVGWFRFLFLRNLHKHGIYLRNNWRNWFYNQTTKAPECLQDLVKINLTEKTILRSTTNISPLHIPFTGRETFVSRSCSVIGPQWWSTLPNNVKTVENEDIFFKNF